jgi:hypothetical protein
MGKSERGVKSALRPPAVSGHRGAQAGDPFGGRFVARRPHLANEIVIVP